MKEREDQRRSLRIEWHAPAMLYDGNGLFGCRCVVSNLSDGGARLIVAEPDAVPDTCKLRLDVHSPARSCSVVWRTSEAIGIAFGDAGAPGVSLAKRESSRR